MIEKDYSNIESKEVPKEILDIINNSKDKYIQEYLDEYPFDVHEVNSPFISANNYLANDEQVLYNCKVISTTTFTGGSMYSIIEKESDDIAFFIKGNAEEGFNIFILK